MPVITIFGIHNEALTFSKLKKNIRGAIAQKVKVINPESVKVFLPLDMDGIHRSEEVAAFIDIFDRPQYTEEVRQELAEVTRDELVKFADDNLKHWAKIETFIRVLQEDDGFAAAIRNDDQTTLKP
jgi:guanylate kinase